MDFIKKFKEDHKLITTSIITIQEKMKRHQSIKTQIEKMRQLLLDHIEDEDKNLYDVLNKSKIKPLIELSYKYSRSMESLSREVFDCMENCMIVDDNFDDDKITAIKEISDKILDRVLLEETVIFPAYKEMLSNQK